MKPCFRLLGWSCAAWIAAACPAWSAPMAAEGLRQVDPVHPGARRRGSPGRRQRRTVAAPPEAERQDRQIAQRGGDGGLEGGEVTGDEPRRQAAGQRAPQRQDSDENSANSEVHNQAAWGEVQIR